MDTEPCQPPEVIPARFVSVTVDGEGPYALDSLGLCSEDVDACRALDVGEECEVGGGAAASFTIRRVQR